MIVLLLLLKSVRATTVALYAVAVSLAVAFLLLRPLGLTLNLLTLAGLVLVFGLLVDNAVVVVEQLILQREKGRARGLAGAALEKESTRAALRAVGLPLVGGTLSTAAVMLPLVYLSGELRALFVPFGVLVAVTLLTSLVGAAVLVPALGRFLPLPELARKRTRWRRRLRRMAAAPYRLAAGHPRLVLLALVLLVGVPLWLLPAELTEPEEESWSVPVQRLAGLYKPHARGRARTGSAAVDRSGAGWARAAFPPERHVRSGMVVRDPARRHGPARLPAGQLGRAVERAPAAVRGRSFGFGRRAADAGPDLRAAGRADGRVHR